jgi:hypothetical protein
MKTSLECTIFAECEQFYLRDSCSDDWPDWFDWIEGHRLLAVKKDCISIGTITNAFLRVHLEFGDGEPDDKDLSVWDQVNECTLRVPSGRIILDEVGGREDNVGVFGPPGTYRVRIYYGKLGDPWTPSQHYKIGVWRAASAPVSVLKCRLCGGACRYKETLQTKIM